MTATHETQIAADSAVPLVRVTREFDAPPAKVFRAHTEADLVAQWPSPRDLERYGGRRRQSYERLDELLATT